MIRILILLIALPIFAFAQVHEMQHGFILSKDDHFGTHLVATGHHSRQADITGELVIEDVASRSLYEQRKALNSEGQVYFLFQAQTLHLPTLKDGQILTGHIVEAQVGKYEPKNIIVKDVKFKVDKVLINVANPFFAEE
jgi:hypothetical protein